EDAKSKMARMVPLKSATSNTGVQVSAILNAADRRFTRVWTNVTSVCPCRRCSLVRGDNLTALRPCSVRQSVPGKSRLGPINGAASTNDSGPLLRFEECSQERQDRDSRQQKRLSFIGFLPPAMGDSS